MTFVTIKVQNLDKVVAGLSSRRAAARREIRSTMDDLSQELRDYIRSTKFSGSPLQSRSGALRNSIYARVTGSGNTATAEIGSDGSVPYAAIQEYGGTVHIPEIVPVTARALHWTSGGRDVFAMHAAAHDVHLPERSYLRSSLDEYTPTIKSRLDDTIARIMGE